MILVCKANLIFYYTTGFAPLIPFFSYFGCRSRNMGADKKIINIGYFDLKVGFKKTFKSS